MKIGVLKTVLAGVLSVIGLILTLPVLLLGIPFWIMSALVEAARRAIRAFQPAHTPWFEMMDFEPGIGWKPKPNLNAYAEADPPFHLTTDERGWRCQTRLEDSDVVVFGDSFAFGHAADDAWFFAEQHPTVRIKAIGANGYNMVQGLLWMERLAPLLKGKTVVWLIYYGNDLLENLTPNQKHYRLPFVRILNGSSQCELVTEHVSREPWSFPSSRDYTRILAEICSPTHLSDRVFAVCEFLIGRARQICDEAGAKLHIVGNPDVDQLRPEKRKWLANKAPDPDAFDVTLPDRRLRQICERLDLNFVALSEHLGPEDHLDHDCHWNPRGHRRVAEIVGGLT